MGAHSAIMTMAPFKIPEVPIPAIARPTINIFEEVATAQIKEPTSKTAKKARKVHYGRRLIIVQLRENNSGEKMMND